MLERLSLRTAWLFWTLSLVACATSVTSGVDDGLSGGGTSDAAAADTGTSDDAGTLSGDDSGSFDATDAGTPPGNDAGIKVDSGKSDAGGGGVDSSVVDAGTPQDSGGSTCTPVINEMMTGVTSSATDEWIEIYNPCSTAIDLTGWKLVYRAGSNTNGNAPSFDTNIYTFASVTIQPGAFLLYAGAGYAGTSDGALASGLANATGAVGIRNAATALVDSLGYGTVSAQNAFIETAAAPANSVVAAPGNSIRRMPDGHDTNNNASDFANTTTPTPRAVNQ